MNIISVKDKRLRGDFILIFVNKYKNNKIVLNFNFNLKLNFNVNFNFDSLKLLIFVVGP